MSPPILLGQLLHGDGLVGWGLFLDLIFVVFPADNLEVDSVLARHVLLLFEQDGRIPYKGTRNYFFD